MPEIVTREVPRTRETRPRTAASVLPGGHRISGRTPATGAMSPGIPMRGIKVGKSQMAVSALRTINNRNTGTVDMVWLVARPRRSRGNSSGGLSSAGERPYRTGTRRVSDVVGRPRRGVVSRDGSSGSGRTGLPRLQRRSLEGLVFGQPSQTVRKPSERTRSSASLE